MKVLLIGNICSGKSTIGGALAVRLGVPFCGIDDCRLRAGDGSASGEAAAWSMFLRTAESSLPTVLEASGAGPFVQLLRHSIRRSGLSRAIIHIDTPIAECRKRVLSRGLSVPYPDFGVPIGEVIDSVELELQKQLRDGWSPVLVRLLGDRPAEENVAIALRALLAVSKLPDGGETST